MKNESPVRRATVCPTCKEITAAFFVNDGRGGAIYRCVEPLCETYFHAPLPEPLPAPAEAA